MGNVVVELRNQTDPIVSVTQPPLPVFSPLHQPGKRRIRGYTVHHVFCSAGNALSAILHGRCLIRLRTGQNYRLAVGVNMTQLSR